MPENMNQTQTAPQTFGPIEVFRSGSFTAMGGDKQTITLQDLTVIAEGYDPENHPAPVVIGHPETDAPAFGWVDRLWVEGEVLKATIRDAAPEFVEMVKSGRYKRVSISLYLPTSDANPTPGELYIRHVGFLGAQAPAVPNLKPVKFAGDTTSCFAIAQDFAAPLSAEQRELAELRREARERKVETLIEQGRVLPAYKEGIMSFAAQLDNTDSISFADGSEVTPQQWFFDYLAKQPQVVQYGEFKAPPGPGDDDLSAHRGAVDVPDGYTVDRSTSDLAARARKVSREQGVSFSDALDMLMMEGN